MFAVCCQCYCLLTKIQLVVNIVYKVMPPEQPAYLCVLIIVASSTNFIWAFIVLTEWFTLLKVWNSISLSVGNSSSFRHNQLTTILCTWNHPFLLNCVFLVHWMSAHASDWFFLAGSRVARSAVFDRTILFCTRSGWQFYSKLDAWKCSILSGIHFKVT